MSGVVIPILQTWGQSLGSELRVGARQLRRDAWISLSLIATLALGIGANGGIMAICDAILLKPRPGVYDVRNLFWLSTVDQAGNYNFVSYPDFLDYRQTCQSCIGLAAFEWREFFLGEARRPVGANAVTSNFFQVLGTSPAIGRGFVPAEDSVPGGPPVAVISDRLWRQEFRSDPQVIGHDIEINGHALTIVGVARPKFTGILLTSPADVWVPIGTYAQLEQDTGPALRRRGDWRFLVFGRLRGAASWSAASAEVETAGRRLAGDYPTTHRGMRYAALQRMRGGLHPFFLISVLPLLGATLAVTVLVLLAMSANVTGLLTARTISRRAELAIRHALGATRLQLVWHVLLPTLLLFAVGGVVALALAPLFARLIMTATPFSFPIELDLSVPRLFVALAVLSGSFGFAFGVLPAVSVTAESMGEGLRDHVTGSTPGKRRRRLMSLLVAGQVWVSLLLVLAVGTLLADLAGARRRLSNSESAANLSVVRVGVREVVSDAASQMTLMNRLLVATRSVPGVSSAGITGSIPLVETPRRGLLYPRAAGLDSLMVWLELASPGFLEALGVRTLIGRGFSEQDVRGSPVVGIVCQSLARRLWGGESPLGKLVALDPSGRAPIRIIGVIPDVPYAGTGADSGSTLFLAYAQFPGDVLSPLLLVRTTGPASRFTGAIRQAVVNSGDVATGATVSRLADEYSASVGPQRTASFLLTVCALIVLAIVGIGLHGVLSHTVVERRRELAIRAALGAPPLRVVASAAREISVQVILGVALGFLSLPLASRIAYALFGAPLVVSVGVASLAATVILVVAYVATLGPLRRVYGMSAAAVLRAS